MTIGNYTGQLQLTKLLLILRNMNYPGKNLIYLKLVYTFQFNQIKFENPKSSLPLKRFIVHFLTTLNLSYLAYSYFYNYKPSPRIIRQRNLRKSRDIVIIIICNHFKIHWRNKEWGSDTLKNNLVCLPKETYRYLHGLSPSIILIFKIKESCKFRNFQALYSSNEKQCNLELKLKHI